MNTLELATRIAHAMDARYCYPAVPGPHEPLITVREDGWRFAFPCRRIWSVTSDVEGLKQIAGYWGVKL